MSRNVDVRVSRWASDNDEMVRFNVGDPVTEGSMVAVLKLMVSWLIVDATGDEDTVLPVDRCVESEVCVCQSLGLSQMSLLLALLTIDFDADGISDDELNEGRFCRLDTVMLNVAQVRRTKYIVVSLFAPNLKLTS